MYEQALELAPKVTVNRTKASQYDTVFGILGEFCFVHWFGMDWRNHSIVDNKGAIDFMNKIEIKTSAFPFSENLNLLVREDYALNRKPQYYVQTIIDLKSANDNQLSSSTKCFIAGYATSEEIDSAPLRDFGSKFGGKGGYKCRYIPIHKLHPAEELHAKLEL